MFSFFRRDKDKSKEVAPAVQTVDSTVTDPAIIAVIAAAITRFREQESGSASPAGFIVRRVRRV